MAAEPLLKMTIDTIKALPREKRAEVYDFARFLRSRTRATPRRSARKVSLLDIAGIAKSRETDISLNHDRYICH